MCEMCESTPEGRAKGRESLLRKAERMEAMASHLRDLAWGQAKPHTDQSERFAVTARSIITDLVNEWM